VLVASPLTRKQLAHLPAAAGLGAKAWRNGAVSSINNNGSNGGINGESNMSASKLSPSKTSAGEMAYRK
jgi:hypothetical protein